MVNYLITLKRIKEPKWCIAFYFSEEKYGQSSPQAAAAWYEYGNALLLKEEENPANGVLGNVNPDAPVPEDDDVGEEDGPDTAAEAAGDEDEGEFEDEEEPEGDLQIAWEALDVSFYLSIFRFEYILILFYLINYVGC